MNEVKRLNRIIDLLISANTNITGYPNTLSMTDGHPRLRFGIWNIILDDANDDMSLTQINDMFRERIDKLMDGKE